MPAIQTQGHAPGLTRWLNHRRNRYWSHSPPNSSAKPYESEANEYGVSEKRGITYLGTPEHSSERDIFSKDGGCIILRKGNADGN